MNTRHIIPFLSPIQRTMVRTALGVLMACGGMSLHAQNTSPLDTAPGVNPGTATNPPAVTPPPPAVTPPPPAVTPPPAATTEGPSLLDNGDFASPAGWPKVGTLEKENGKNFYRMVQQKPGAMLSAYREMPIPAGVKGLKITIRYRTAGVAHGKLPWNDARAIFHFLDASRKTVKPDPGAIVFSTKAATWTEGSLSCTVPDGASTLVLMPSLFMAASGTLDLAEVRVTALDDATVAQMAAAAAAKTKKTADEAAIVNQELALPTITPELKVSGNKLVTADGKVVWLQGVNVVRLGWSPNGEGTTLWAVHLAIDDWHANIIRLPVSNDLWFGRGREGAPNDADAYRALVDNAVKLAAARGAYILLDLHRFLTPDASCVEFWKDAAARYKNNPAVLFDIFNEPHDTTWDVWQKGGAVQIKQKDGTFKTVQGVGMQALVDAVRGTGAHNIIAAGGLGYAYDLTGILKGYALDDKGGNGIMYATHFYNWHKGWTAHFMDVAAKYPILVGETGGDIHKMGFIPLADQEDPYTWAPDAIGFFQKNHLNWTGWCFDTGATPAMLLDMNTGAPNPYWGQFVKDALAGKQFEMKKER